VGKLNGGGPLNQVPEFATMAFNVRVGSQKVVDDVLSRVASIEKRYTSDGFECKIQGQFHSPPKLIDGDASVETVRQRVTSAMKASGRTIAWQDTGGACDGNKLHAFGLPNIDTMGPTGGNLHSPTEYCEIFSLVAAAKTIVHLIAEAGCEP
jgi:glutamate carboxypeptidase